MVRTKKKKVIFYARVKKKVNKKCEVTDTRRCPTCGNRNYFWECPNKAVTKIKDIVCKHGDNKPFYVCRKHKKEFLKCDKDE